MDAETRRHWPWGLGVTVAAVTAGLTLRQLRQPGAAEVVKMLGGPAPASTREVTYVTDELGGLMPEPSYRLVFRADDAEVEQLLARRGFQPDGEPWPVAPIFPEAAGVTNAVSYQRPRTVTHHCGVERLWWDRAAGRVYYYRFCP
jgi:hypothetical protein